MRGKKLAPSQFQKGRLHNHVVLCKLSLLLPLLPRSIPSSPQREYHAYKGGGGGKGGQGKGGGVGTGGGGVGIPHCTSKLVLGL